MDYEEDFIFDEDIDIFDDIMLSEKKEDTDSDIGTDDNSEDDFSGDDMEEEPSDDTEGEEETDDTEEDSSDEETDSGDETADDMSDSEDDSTSDEETTDDMSDTSVPESNENIKKVLLLKNFDAFKDSIYQFKIILQKYMTNSDMTTDNLTELTYLETIVNRISTDMDFVIKVQLNTVEYKKLVKIFYSLKMEYLNIINLFNKILPVNNVKEDK